jgi:hypothetical protein
MCNRSACRPLDRDYGHLRLLICWTPVTGSRFAVGRTTIFPLNALTTGAPFSLRTLSRPPGSPPGRDSSATPTTQRVSPATQTSPSDSSSDQSNFDPRSISSSFPRPPSDSGGAKRRARIEVSSPAVRTLPAVPDEDQHDSNPRTSREPVVRPTTRIPDLAAPSTDRMSIKGPNTTQFPPLASGRYLEAYASDGRRRLLGSTVRSE